MNREKWDQSVPSNSPMAPGTKSKFEKERVHRERSSESVRLISVVLVRQNSRKDHARQANRWSTLDVFLSLSVFFWYSLRCCV